MEVSTTLCMWCGSTCQDLDEYRRVMGRCKAAGFPCADVGFGGCGMLLLDDWRERILRLREHADAIGLTINQSHLPFFLPERLHDRDKEGDWSFFSEMLRRGLEAAALLGASWTVYHPVTDFAADGSPTASLALNRRRLTELLETAHRVGVGIAAENMFYSSYSIAQRRFCAIPEELCELADGLDDPLLGICWDTGHAHLMGLDQARCLRLIGPRLKAVHIQDNRGAPRDEHLAPFMGTIDWPSTMRTLWEIGYAGELTFEVFGPNVLPEPSLKDSMAALLYRIGRHLIALREDPA